MMTKEQAAHAHIDILQAFLDGKTIESRGKEPGCEWGASNTPAWDFFGCYYRVKPEPRSFWVGVPKAKKLVHLYGSLAEAQQNLGESTQIVELKEVIE